MCYGHRAQLSSACQVARSISVNLTGVLHVGHSLGGGYAACALLHALAKHPVAAVKACAGGGVLTFGAPLVLSQQSRAQERYLLADLLPEEHKL